MKREGRLRRVKSLLEEASRLLDFLKGTKVRHASYANRRPSFVTWLNRDVWRQPRE